MVTEAQSEIADLFVRSFYSSFDDETLRSILDIGRTYEETGATEALALNGALERELRRRDERREGAA
jgi:hypothetical protein